MSAPAYWVDYRASMSDTWYRSPRPYMTRDAAEDAQRDLRHQGFEAQLEESA